MARSIFASSRQASFADGVNERECIWYNEYVGSAMALEAAGLIRKDQLPGQPGRGKTRVRISPAGMIYSGFGAAEANRMTGARCINRLGEDKYSVQVNVDKEIGRARIDASWEQARLRAEAIQKAKLSKACHLRLVWSAPE